MKRHTLKILRGLTGWTQAQLAKLLDYSAMSISLIEVGSREPSLAFYRALADVLGCNVGDVLSAYESGDWADLVADARILGKID